MPNIQNTVRILFGLILATFSVGLPPSLHGSEPAPAIETTVKIQMADGTNLVASLFLPQPERLVPAVLIRTPYGRGQHVEEARFWAANGYAVMVQDTRGKFESEGEYIPFLNELEDGLTTLDWIQNQAWCDGNIGMWGSSYLAYCELVVAGRGHPALKSIFSISGWLESDNQIFHGGANHIMLSLPWILHEESQTNRSLGDYDLEEVFEYLPLKDVFKSLGLESQIWNEEYKVAVLDDQMASNIDIPVFHMTGWNDFVYDAALDVYGKVEAGTDRLQKLVVGPWFHDQFYTTYTEVGDEDFGPQSAMGREKLMEMSLRWFDSTLKNTANGLTAEPPVNVFVMGANEWKEYDHWPPNDVHYENWYLGSHSGANSLEGDGFLSRDVPKHQSSDTYQFNPMNPVPTYGGPNFHFFLHLIGIKDQREIEKRQDVLIYSSEPLTEDLEIVGPLKVVLFASTEGLDTDFTAKLVEVRPNGYARIIEEGIIRASYRNGSGVRELLNPGTVYELMIDIGASAILIKKDHGLRLEISSSNFPKYDRNPNNGEDPLEANKLETVQQHVYHGGSRPSRIILPVMSRAE